MIYLDNGATSFRKPPGVYRAVERAMYTCANPGRGGYPAAMEASETVYACREAAAELFHCRPEQVALTTSCTHGLNIAIRSVVKPGGRVIVSGFEHNAVTRPLHALGADIRVAGRRLFDWEDTLSRFGRELKQGADAAVFTHVSNVFGYILPVEQLAEMCRKWRVPFIIDAAQSAGALPVDLQALGADFIAMPGHKGLYGPQGTGLLLCGAEPEPLLRGGTGSQSILQEMPEDLPDRLEAGTHNMPGIAGLLEGLRFVEQQGVGRIAGHERHLTRHMAARLRDIPGAEVFYTPEDGAQTGVLSFRLDGWDCEALGEALAAQGAAVRAGLHCAPLAHRTAGTLETGTVRCSFSAFSTTAQVEHFARILRQIVR